MEDSVKGLTIFRYYHVFEKQNAIKGLQKLKFGNYSAIIYSPSGHSKHKTFVHLQNENEDIFNILYNFSHLLKV